METIPNLLARSHQHIWHPCSQMKTFETDPPFIVNHAEGSYLHTNQGIIIDAIASWWCKSLGHGHPAILSAIKSQLERFEHVIGANTTHPLLVQLGEKLAEITKLQYSFFASDGSSAVEIAMKLALHANQLKGRPQRKQFIALRNAYHGETLATLSISDLGLYKKPYKGFGVDCQFIDVPYVNKVDTSTWKNADTEWALVLPKLEQLKQATCAIVVEPILQGAGGMRIYSADFLTKLAGWARKNSIYLIADEIMTGIGRTGRWLASEHSMIQPDLICLSKGLTGGSLPFSCVLIDKPIYMLFYDDVEKGKSFLHSHTYSGNALAVSAALATLDVIEKEDLLTQANHLGHWMYEAMESIARITGKLSNVRFIGAMVAADLITEGLNAPGIKLQQEALRRGALLRPLGNTLYWLPPLTTSKKTIEQLAEITLNSIKAIYS